MQGLATDRYFWFVGSEDRGRNFNLVAKAFDLLAFHAVFELIIDGSLGRCLVFFDLWPDFLENGFSPV